MARQHKRAIGGYTCALVAVDLLSEFKLVYYIKHTACLEKTLVEIRLEVHSNIEQ